MKEQIFKTGCLILGNLLPSPWNLLFLKRRSVAYHEKAMRSVKKIVNKVKKHGQSLYGADLKVNHAVNSLDTEKDKTRRGRTAEKPKKLRHIVTGRIADWTGD